MFLTAALAAFVTPARAGIVVNQSSPISLSVFVPCAAGGAGEVVDLSGFVHTLVTATINGNNVSGKTQNQPQGVIGVGETTGLKYQGTGVTTDNFKMSFRNGQATETFVNRFDIIGQGPGNNLYLQETAHITVNANGTVTVLFDLPIVVCK